MSTAASQSRMVRIGGWAAVVAGAALLIKVAHIFVVDGEESLIQVVLYLGAILVAIVAAAGVGARYGSTRGKKISIGFAAFFGFIFFLTMLSDGIGAAIDALADVPEYVSDEAPIALAGIAWLVVGYKLRTGSVR